MTKAVGIKRMDCSHLDGCCGAEFSYTNTIASRFLGSTLWHLVKIGEKAHNDKSKCQPQEHI